MLKIITKSDQVRLISFISQITHIHSIQYAEPFFQQGFWHDPLWHPNLNWLSASKIAVRWSAHKKLQTHSFVTHMGKSLNVISPENLVYLLSTYGLYGYWNREQTYKIYRQQ